MAIEQKPFVAYNEEKTQETFTVKLNKQERKDFNEWKHLIQQEKDSTAIKQLASIGAEVLLATQSKVINGIILGNYRKNKRMGIVTFE